MIEHIADTTPQQRLGIEGFEPFRGRDLDGVIYVAVYRNLNEEQKTGQVRWSIRDRVAGVVVGYADKLALYGAVSHVGTAAQQRIADGGPREVHAWVWGALHLCPPDSWRDDARRVTYHPHEEPQFRWVDTGEWFHRAQVVRFDSEGMWAVPSIPLSANVGTRWRGRS